MVAFSILETTWQDVRYALRGMGRSPGFTAVVVICLALGIGANTAIFTVINAVLLRPLPFKDSASLVSIDTTPNVQHLEIRSNPTISAYYAVQAQSTQFEDVTAIKRNLVNLTGGAAPEWAYVTSAPAGFFPLLGISALRGRVFSGDEEQPGHDSVAVLSYSEWQSRFSGDDRAIGRTIFLDAKAYTIVGIMPKLFNFPQGSQLWIPLRLADIPKLDSRRQYIEVIARLRRGVSLEHANSVLAAIGARLAISEPKVYVGLGLVADSIAERRVAWYRGALWLLFGAVVFVLLIACVNVSNLFLARGWKRQKEFAVRAALGATRGRIIGQLLTECVVIALFGGVLGLAFAVGCMGVLRSIAPPDIPRIDQLHMDGSVFVFTLGVSIFAGILFGMIPASQMSRRDLNTSLKDDKSAVGGIHIKLGRFQFRDLLTTSEVALCLILVIGSTLVLRSFVSLLNVNSGFRTDHILSMRIAPSRYRYPQSEQRAAIMLRMVEEIRNVPGVSAVSLRVDPLLSGFGFDSNFRVLGSGAPLEEQDLQARYVTSDFFRAIGVSLLQGRVFDLRDDQSRVPLAIVNESFAKNYFPGKSPVGERVSEETTAGKPDTVREIVGEVSDFRDSDISVAPQPTVFMQFAQSPFLADIGFVIVRTAVDPVALVKSIEAQIWTVDRDIPIEEVETADQLRSDFLGEPKFHAILLSAFAGLGLILALVGIYGVVVYSVGQRTREIGIRIALGAQRRDVMILVLAGGMLPVVAGIAIGSAGALALTRLVRSFLYEIKPTDPATFVGAAIAFSAIALLACYQPARRATRVDPMVALRHE